MDRAYALCYYSTFKCGEVSPKGHRVLGEKYLREI
jgi:hypothetical protein